MRYLYAMVVVLTSVSSMVSDHHERGHEEDAYLEGRVRAWEREESQRLEVPDVNEWDD